MTEFSKDVIQQMDINQDGLNKYYVYGLLDPTNYQPFYIGKGCGNRVFKHAKNALTAKEKNEDDVSLKISTIQDIIEQGKEVLCMIYRWGMTENEAFAVEATLIDYIPGLTNIQSGHNNDYGITTVEDLQESLSIPEYNEPQEDYVIIKTKQKNIDERGSLYEATRRYWHADLNRAKKYKYVVAAVQGIAKEVFEVEEWYTSEEKAPRIEFIGKPTTNPNMTALKGKRLPATYMKKGLASPFLYKQA